MSNFNLSTDTVPNSKRWPARLAWVVILALTAFVAYRNARVDRTPGNNEITMDDIRIRMLGEELIGLKALGTLAGPTQSSQLAQNQERLFLQMDEFARSPKDKLHVAIIAGEVLGGPRALMRLEGLSGSSTSSELAADVAALHTIYSSSAAALDPTMQDLLIRRHDYFAHVALAYGLNANAGPRIEIESSARRAMIALGFAGLVFALLFVGAAGFFITAIVLWVKGRLRTVYVPNRSANTAFLEGFAIYFVLFILGFGLLRRFFTLTSLQWEWIAWLIIPAVLFWIGRRGITAEERRLALGWHTGKGVLREIGAGLAGYLAGIVVMAAGFTVTYFLIKHSGVSPEHPLIHILKGDRWHVLGLYALVSVFAPVIEETMFRGALFHHMRRRWGWAVSAPVVAFIFAIIHPQGWAAVPVLGSIALVLAALREWRGSLIAPMVAHAFNNFLALTLALALLR